MDSWSINLLKEGWCPNLQSKLSTFYTRRGRLNLRELKWKMSLCDFLDTPFAIYIQTHRHCPKTTCMPSCLMYEPAAGNFPPKSSQIKACKFTLLFPTMFFLFCSIHMRPQYRLWICESISDPYARQTLEWRIWSSNFTFNFYVIWI
jgi:hypothetical protein